jgi:uncharacterized heparinase superfamily protein
LKERLPEPLAVGDSAKAHELAQGRIELAGRISHIGNRSPWRAPHPSADFTDALHGFDWLDDAMVAGARDLRVLHGWVQEWLRVHRGGHGPGWTPRLAGRRLARLGPAAGRLLTVSGPRDARRLTKAISAHIRFLGSRHARETNLASRAEAASGLLIGTLSIEGHRRIRDRAKRALADLAEAVGEDGGVADRRPDVMAAVFIHLAWTAHALRADGDGPLPAHEAALRRLGPSIRALRLGDGGLLRFHGSDASPASLPPDALDRAFALAGEAARGPRQTACMGYERLSSGRMAVIVDAAPPPQTTGAAAATLGLEIGIGRHRLFGSVGPGERIGGEWPIASRATAAHSAVEIAGVSSARLEPVSAATALRGRRLSTSPATVEAERSSDIDGLWFRADHDGYLARFGVMVTRRLQLLVGGAELRGEDTLTCPSLRARQRFDRMADSGNIPFCVRFHLAPDVEAQLGRDGRSVTLALPDDSRWLFAGSGGYLRLTEGVWIDGTAGRVRPTRQIVLNGEACAYFGRVTWSLQRAPSGQAASVSEALAVDAEAETRL